MTISRGLLCSLILTLTFGCSASKGGEKGVVADSGPPPNFILVVTDDMDEEAIDHMPGLKGVLVEEGMYFDNAFASYPLCGPSRVSMLTGRYAHNHRVLHNGWGHKGFNRFQELALERSTIATWLSEAGYETALIGKYINGYPGYPDPDPKHVPAGWRHWYATFKPSPGGTGYFDYRVSDNGTPRKFGDKAEDYETDVLLSRTKTFFAERSEDPFFLTIATTVPHAPPTVAPRHRSSSEKFEAPYTPAYDEEDVGDKPPWIRELPRLSKNNKASLDRVYSRRILALKALDEFVEEVDRLLIENDLADNTYIIFISDNGMHFGEHRLDRIKSTLYEESIQVPLVIRGPRIRPGSHASPIACNVDITPTILDLAGLDIPSQVDGRSLGPILRGEDEEDWRDGLLVESWNIKGNPGLAVRGVRTEELLYAEYTDGSKELYDLTEDPYQLENIIDRVPESFRGSIAWALSRMIHSSGEDSREAEKGIPALSSFKKTDQNRRSHQVQKSE